MDPTLGRSRHRWHWGYVSVPAALLLWYGATRGVPAFIFPGPVDVLHTASSTLATAGFYHDLGASLFRLFVGFGAGAVLGTGLGVAAGRFRGIDEALSPFVSFFQAVPPITWVPLFVILFGIGNLPIISVVTMASLFPVIIASEGGMRAIPRSQVLAARALGARGWPMLTRFYLPALQPNLAGGLRIGFGIAWRSLVASEMVGGNNGIGFSIQTAGQVGNMSAVVFGILVIGALSLLFDGVVLRPLERGQRRGPRPRRWRSEGQASA